MNEALDLFTDSCRNESFAKLDLPRRQKEVLDTLSSMKRATLFEIAERLNRPAHTVCGRITELRDKQLVRIVDSKVNPVSGKSNSVYEVSGGS